MESPEIKLKLCYNCEDTEKKNIELSDKCKQLTLENCRLTDDLMDCRKELELARKYEKQWEEMAKKKREEIRKEERYKIMNCDIEDISSSVACLIERKLKGLDTNCDCDCNNSY